MKEQNGKGVGDIESVNKTFKLIELLKKLEGARLVEIADRLGWPKSTVHVHLQTLRENEYVVQIDGEYYLSFRFLEICEYVKNRNEEYAVIEPYIERLAEETGERVQFVVNEHSYGVYLRIAEGKQAVSTGSHIGRRRNMLHATAAGKAILANLPDEEVREILDKNGLPALTANTITEEAELIDELEAIRERGYALNHEEHIQGLKAVAVAIIGADDDVVGAVSIAVPAHRMSEERFTEELPNRILALKNEVELEITYK